MEEIVAKMPAGRRTFFKWIVTSVVGLVAAIPPLIGFVAVVLNPLRKRASGSTHWVRIAPLAALPEDGVPRKFSVSAARVDAWTQYPETPIGAVYLRRTGERAVTALNAICPHAGGFIDYEKDCQCYICPLHNSQFGLNGNIQSPSSPSPRPMDSLTVELRGDEIWVQFEDFLAGIRRKIPA